jgi:hypothetical protein
MNVEFIYDQDCPNVRPTREVLFKAFCQLQQTPNWQEWDRNCPNSPHYVRKHGSPTILVNGEDISGFEPDSGANCCRIYDGAGVPSFELVYSKLQHGLNVKQESKNRLFGALGTAAIGPSLGTVLIAKASCPFCYPAVVGILTSLGLGFLLEGKYFYILLSGFLGISVFGLFYKARSRRGYAPFLVGVLGAYFILISQVIRAEGLFYLGFIILLLASVWNLVPLKKNCTKCS